VVDYRRFLAQTESLVLPVFGPSVHTGTRVLRLTTAPPPPGWYKITIAGRNLTVDGPAEASSLQHLPLVRGWYFNERLVHENARAEKLHLLPADEISRLAPVTARRWHSGQLVFEAEAFETDIEGLVREALADGRGLSDVKGVPAPLRAAAGYLLLDQASRRRQIRFAPDEVRLKAGPVGLGGPAEAEEALTALEAEREQARREWQALLDARAAADLEQQVAAVHQARRVAHDAVAGTVRHRATRAAADPVERARDALEKAGASVDSIRRLEHGARIEVTYRYRDSSQSLIRQRSKSSTRASVWVTHRVMTW
jgi:hypothetical protein